MNFSDWIDRELWGTEPEPVTINVEAVITVSQPVFKLPRSVVKYLQQQPQYKDAMTADLLERPYTEDCAFENIKGVRTAKTKSLATWIKYEGKYYHTHYLPGLSATITFWASNPITTPAPAFTFEVYKSYLPYILKAVKHYGLTELPDDELYEILT